MHNRKETLDLVESHELAFKALLRLVKGETAIPAHKPKRLTAEQRMRWGRQLSLRGIYCHWCDCKVVKQSQSAANQLTLDHVIPRDFGGPNHKDNLVISCRKCNEERDNKPPISGVLRFFGVTIDQVRKYL